MMLITVEKNAQPESPHPGGGCEKGIPPKTKKSTAHTAIISRTVLLYLQTFSNKPLQSTASPDTFQ